MFIEPFNFSLFSVTGWGIDLDYCDIEWFTLETNRDHCVVFEIATKYCISDSFVDYAKAFDCVDHNKLWKILKEMGIPDHLTWLLRNLYAGQEATVRTGHETTDWFQIRKEYIKVVYCHPAYLTSMQSTS